MSPVTTYDVYRADNLQPPDVCSVDDAPPNSTAWTGAASPPTRLSERMHDRIRTGALSILPSSS